MAAPRLQPINTADYIPFRRADDPRLAEKVIAAASMTQITPGSVVILGLPDDRGVAINHGRLGSREGPSVFRQCFYRMPLGAEGELNQLKLFDVGNIVLEETIAGTHEAIRKVVSALHRRNATVITIGGGHDLSFGSLLGFRDAYKQSVLVNIDAHLDVRPNENDGQIGSGTAFRRLLVEAKVPGQDIYFVGYHEHCNAETHVKFARELGARLWPWQELTRGGRLKVMHDLVKHWSVAPAVGVSWDMDSLAAAVAPGVSAPVGLGFSAEEAIQVAQILGSHPQILQLELMELNPLVDRDGMATRFAAILLWYFLAARLREDI